MKVNMGKTDRILKMILSINIARVANYYKKTGYFFIGFYSITSFALFYSLYSLFGNKYLQ